MARITGAPNADAALAAPQTASYGAAVASDDDVTGMTVAALKARLQSLGSKTTGKKQELQERLRAHLFLAEDHTTDILQVNSVKEVRPQLSPSPARPWQGLGPTSSAVQAQPASRGIGTDKVGVSRLRVAPASSVVARPTGAANPPGVQPKTASVCTSGGAQSPSVSVDRSKKRKGTDELGLTRHDRAMLVRRCVINLYKRCLRSAERCPDDSWAQTMYSYVRNRFRDSMCTDAVPLRLSLGEAEIEQMNMYHEARERSVVEKSLRFAASEDLRSQEESS